MMMVVIIMIIASYTDDDDRHRDDDCIVHKWWWSSSWWWSHHTQMMMVIIILTALYIGDDVCIVYIMHWPHTLSYFSVTEKGTNEQGDSRSRKWPNLIKMSGVCPLCPELGLMQFLIWSYWIVISGKSQNAISPFSVSGLSHFLGEIYFHFFVTTFISLQPRTAAQWNANKAFLQTKMPGCIL